MYRRITLKTPVAICAVMLIGAVPAQAVSPPVTSQCEVGKYYKLCVWSGPDYSGVVRSLAFNVNYVDIGPVFVVRSYKNWQADGCLIDIHDAEHPLGEWAKDPNVNDGAGIPAKALAVKSS